ncbi:MAG TPA: glycosyltransferase family 2 protein [Chitinophagaceae bacterium]|nr:glycosyltransferase family 2 protein [Chitinophagaceae bacterium]
MNNKPLVSVIIATYNRASMIADAIRSVLDQTYPNKEIIVVDDGSTDNTAEIVRQFEGIDFIVQDHKRQAAARNTGWKRSKGKYIATLDSDDKWNPDFLEKCVAFLEAGDHDFVFANWEQQRQEGGTSDFLSTDPLLKPYYGNRQGNWFVLEQHELRDLYLAGCPSPSSSLVLRASSLVLGWNEKMNIGDDWCMLLDLIMTGKCRAAFTLDVLWWKHINCNNIYDGRDHFEVNRLLYVEDARTLMDRYADKLTREEYRALEHKYLFSLVRSAKHSMFNYSNVKEGFTLMRRALATNPVYTTRVFTRLFMGMGMRQFKKETEPVKA